MIKKVVLTSLILSLISVSLFSQKIDKERIGELNYTQLPSNPLSKEFKEYNIVAKGAHDDLYRRDAIAGRIGIKGFDKVDNDNYQFSIEIEEYPFQSAEPELQTKKESKKVDGVEKTYTYYYYTSNTTYKYVLSVRDRDRNSIFGRDFSGSEGITGDQSSSSSDAYKNFKEKRTNIVNGILPAQLTVINEFLNNEIGFPIKNFSVLVYKVKAKKFVYDEFDQAFEIFTKALEIVKADENKTVEAMEVLNPAIEIWNKALTESNVEDKKARINRDVTCAALYNIAQTYLITKDYPKAIEYFNKCESVDKGFGNAKYLIKFAEELQARVNANI